MSYQEVMYNEHNKGLKEGLKEGEIKGLIEMGFECNKSYDEIIGKIIEKFTLSHETAEEYVNKYRPKGN